jgi:glycerate kinase
MVAALLSRWPFVERTNGPAPEWTRRYGSRVSGPVVCAPDKLRGALSAAAAADALARGAARAGAAAIRLPIADGGEGTLDALRAAGVVRPVECSARGPFGERRRARIGDLGDGRFLVEAAEAIALARVPVEHRDPWRTSSAGVGDLLLAALDRGARELLVGVGGTANVDGGLGLLRAVGAATAGDTGAALLAEPRLELDGVDPRLREVRLVLLHDVDVPLHGPDGAALLFGPQKGLSPADARRADAGLERLARVLPRGVAERPGAGAAGGLGAALYALGAEGASGATTVLGLVGLPAALDGARLCLTAEGRVDRSSGRGKAVAAVAAAARGAGVPCVVLAGRVDEEGEAALRALGARVEAIGPADRPLEEALAATGGELEDAAERVTRLVG